MTINTIDTATTFATIKYPGDKTQYEDLSITFGVDENLTNMREIFDWMIGATHPRDYDQYKDLVEKEPFYSLDKGMGGVLRDVTVMVLSNQDRPIMEYQFKDAFPINLTPLDMDATPAEIDYLEAQATFSYTSYTMESLI